MLLSNVFVPQSIRLGIEGKTKDAAFTELIGLITAIYPECDHAEMYSALNSRESKMSAGIGSGIAVPHGYCRSISTITGAVGISKAGIDYSAIDGQPVHRSIPK
jgi:mannitol/fructose-specific phosphotransferase system IIA component (Ntr-type)